MSLPEEFRLSACAGKVAFDSPALAVKVAKRRRDQRYPLKAYRCKVCGKYHLGKPLSKGAKA